MRDRKREERASSDGGEEGQKTGGEEVPVQEMRGGEG